MRGAGRGRGTRESSSPDPGLGNATRPRAPAFRILGEPRLGDRERGVGVPRAWQRRFPQHGAAQTQRGLLQGPRAAFEGKTPGVMGIPVLCWDPRACSSTLPRDGARLLSVCEVFRGAAPEISGSGVFRKERSGNPQETGALNSGASPLIVQTQFLYESAANRELWLDICG